MNKGIDISKFRKSITKNITGISAGFNDPKHWIDTGSYALNYLITNDFNRGIPLGKITLLSGESGCLPAYAKVKIRYKKNEYIEKEVTIEELKNIYNSGEYDIQIDTPDGYQNLGKWYDKGELEMVRIATNNFTTDCAASHLIQKEDETWVLAGELERGDKIITKNGVEDVIETLSMNKEECYDFEVLHSNHRYWGDGISSHNSGKSLVSAGSITRHAQEMGAFVVLLDSENALDESWLKEAGVDTDESSLLRIGVAMVDDVAKIINDFVKQYKDDYSDNLEEAPKILFVVDSLGMLLTPTDADQFEKGEMKGDMGRKAKSLTALLRNLVHVIEPYNIGMVCTNHIYQSQDMFSPEPKISGGEMVIFAPSISIALSKFKLKEDDEGKKVTDVRGIRAKCKVLKSRFSKPFETIELSIPYDKGIDRYSGLFDLFSNMDLLEKIGNRYKYLAKDGEEIIGFKKEWLTDHSMFDKIISDLSTEDDVTISEKNDNEMHSEIEQSESDQPE